MKRGQFTFYRSYFEAVKELNKRDANAVLFAVCAYALDEEEPQLSGVPKVVFSLIRPTLDSGRKKAEVGAKGGRASEGGGRQRASKAEAEGGQDAGESGAARRQGAREKENEKETEIELEKETEIEREKETETEHEGETPCGGDDPARGAEERAAYGTYGWVKLTQREHETLLAQMGEEELERCMAYVDESAQKTGNKNGWKDWALVVYTCHRDRWGIKKAADPGSGRTDFASGRTDFQPSAERIRKNALWLDEYMENRKKSAAADGKEANEN